MLTASIHGILTQKVSSEFTSSGYDNLVSKATFIKTFISWSDLARVILHWRYFLFLLEKLLILQSHLSSYVLFSFSQSCLWTHSGEPKSLKPLLAFLISWSLFCLDFIVPMVPVQVWEFWPFHLWYSVVYREQSSLHLGHDIRMSDVVIHLLLPPRPLHLRPRAFDVSYLLYLIW